MNKIPFFVGALVLAFLTLFFAFGFLASFELQGAAGLPWKIGYAILATLSVTGIITLLRKAFRKRT